LSPLAPFICAFNEMPPPVLVTEPPLINAKTCGVMLAVVTDPPAATPPNDKPVAVAFASARPWAVKAIAPET
jgi:hypothetical protein